MPKFRSKNLKTTENIAKDFWDKLTKSTDQDTATVVGLYGDLGSGKTAFTKLVAKNIGIKETVSSPTFSLLKKFKIKNNKFKNLIHLDAYRFDNEKELLALGWHDLVCDSENLIFIEWPEKVFGIMPKDHICIYFSHYGEHERGIEIHHNKHKKVNKNNEI